MLDAYKGGDTKKFNAALSKYQATLESHSDPLQKATYTINDLDLSTIEFEVFFNNFQPFYIALVLYFGVFILAVSSWLGWAKPLNIAAASLLVLTFLLHTYALWARVVISGRPPVTNLYSSAVFIGWGCVLLGLIIEAVYRIGVGNVVSAVAGFATLIIAHFLTDGDTFQMLQAVLDTQFWLATHVVCITLGYSTAYLAGLIGILYILRGVYTPSLTPKISKEFARMIYGTICFSLFFSFVGTVLGGLWADDSWGRFWGWDPKENGALIIVIWNALILHARWGAMIRDRGLAVLAVVGNIVTTWSWFGVNALGAGLHSYGFISGVVFAICIAVLIFVHIMIIGIVPLPQWISSEIRDVEKYREKQAKDGLDLEAMLAAPHPVEERSVLLAIIAYLNPIYSCYLGFILLASYSVPSLAENMGYLGYLAVAYLFIMVMLFVTTTGLLQQHWAKAYICGSVASVYLLANLIWIMINYKLGNALYLLIPALAWPVIMLVVLNIRFSSPANPNSAGTSGTPSGGAPAGMKPSANKA
jgi:ABC-type transport system involved in cytochrome c biogenesis permease subunit